MALDRSKAVKLTPLKGGEGLLQKATPVSMQEKDLRQRRSQFLDHFDLGFLRFPAEYYLKEHEIKGNREVTLSGPHGNLYHKAPLRDQNVPKIKEGIRSFHSCIELPQYSYRVAKLGFLSHVVAEQGLSDKAYKLMKRLAIVGFTTHISNFKRLVRTIARECGFLSTKVLTSRNPTGRSDARRQYRPSFTGEKTHKNLGVTVPLWDRSPTVMSDDEEW
jgi:hypothetical protein